MKDTFALRLALFVAWPFIWGICLPLMAVAALLAWPLVFSKHMKISYKGQRLEKKQ